MSPDSSGESLDEDLEELNPGMSPADLLFDEPPNWKCGGCSEVFKTWQGARDHQKANCEETGIELLNAHRERWFDDTEEFDWWVSTGSDDVTRKTMELGDALHYNEEFDADVRLAEPPRGGPA